LFAAATLAGASALHAVDRVVCKDHSWALQGLSMGLWNTIPACDLKVAKTKLVDVPLPRPRPNPGLDLSYDEPDYINITEDESQRGEIKQSALPAGSPDNPFTVDQPVAIKYPPLWAPPTLLSLPICPYAPQCWLFVPETTGGK